jgi:hypothetical protein
MAVASLTPPGIGHMKVIICGAGQVGWQIARHLSGENNDVTVVDNNPAWCAAPPTRWTCRGCRALPAIPTCWTTAGARDADMIIAATILDEVNMVTCQVAHSVFSVPRKIARLRSQSYLDAIYSDLYRRDHLPIDVVISPEREVAEAAMRGSPRPRPSTPRRSSDGKAQLWGSRSTRTARSEHAAAPADRSLFDPARHRRGHPARGHAVCARTGRPAVPGTTRSTSSPIPSDVAARWRSSARPDRSGRSARSSSSAAAMSGWRRERRWKTGSRSAPR